MPWITPAALEQHNDTKDVNWVQRPLATGGKVVDNPVTWSGVTGNARFWVGVCHTATVENAEMPRRLSTRY